MTDPIRGKRVLVVEDEYLLADDLRAVLEAAGMEVLGPIPDAAAALTLAEGEEDIDAALLDINLGGASALSVADVLARRAIPFAFATGYDESELPQRFTDVVRLEKPIRGSDAVDAVRRLIG